MASLAEADEAERSRRLSAASATWNPTRCPEEELHADFANGFFACAMSRSTPSISSAEPLGRMRSGSQSQLGLPAGLLQAAGSRVGFGKSLPEGAKGDDDNDEEEEEEEVDKVGGRDDDDDDGGEKASSPSFGGAVSVVAAQRPRSATQQRATMAARSMKAKPPRRKERRDDDPMVVIAAAKQVLPRREKKKCCPERERERERAQSMAFCFPHRKRTPLFLPTSVQPSAFPAVFLSSQVSFFISPIALKRCSARR